MEENKWELPEGWVETPLESLFEFVLGGDWGKPESEADGEEILLARVIRGTEFKFWEDEKGRSAVTRAIKRNSLEKRSLQKGDLVIEISGGGPTQPVGRTILIDDDAIRNSDLPLVCSNFFRLIRLDRNVYPPFIQFALQQQYLSNGFSDFQSNTTNLRNLQFKDFQKGVSIPLPPLAEQRRIVARLDALLGEVRAARERLSALPGLIQALRQAVLSRAVSGELTKGWRERNPEVESAEEFLNKLVEEKGIERDFRAHPIPSWVVTQLKTVAGFTSGYAFRTKDFSEEGYQLIRMGNLYEDKLDLSRNPVFLPSDFDPKIVQKYSVSENDILITLTGTKYKKDYGYAVFIDTLDKPLLVNQRILNVKPDITPKFIHLLCRSEVFRDQFFEFETGGVNQGNVSSKAVEQIQIPIPPLAEQQEIVRRVEAAFETIDALEESYAAAWAQVEALPGVILGKAFRGEL